MTDLNVLLERVKKATGPDKELDADMLKALGFHSWAGRMSYPQPPVWADFGGSDITASVDAALALVERALPGIWWVLAKGRMTSAEPLYACELLFGHDQQIAIADGATLPLAILAALLSALISKEAQS